MEYLIYVKDLADPIKNKSMKLITMQGSEWMTLDQKSLDFIRKKVGYTIFHHV